jgi:uncharacterized protein YmfQ (DUF2313 family)
MGMSAADYVQQIKALLPLGPAWPREEDSAQGGQLAGFAQELARLDARARQLVEEMDWRSTNELFEDWERVAGLPDACVLAFADDQTLAQRRAALVGRFASLGGQSIAYFTQLAADLGYAVTITEFREHTVEDDVDAAINGPAWNFAWSVNSSLNTVIELTVDGLVDEPLAAWSNALLECVIKRFAPAHSFVFFSYS